MNLITKSNIAIAALILTLVAGCGGQTQIPQAPVDQREDIPLEGFVPPVPHEQVEVIVFTPIEQSEVDKYIAEHGRQVIVFYLIGNRDKRDPNDVIMKYVKHFITQGADVNARGNAGILIGLTPLHEAVSLRHSDLVKFLVSQGADVNAQIGYGITPLFWAARFGSADVVKFLIASGADVNLKTNDGKTPLDNAESDEIKNILRDAGGL